MSEVPASFASVIRSIASALDPLADAVATPDAARALLADLGVIVDQVPRSVLDLAPKAAAVRADLAALTAASGGAELGAALTLSMSLVDLTGALIQLGPELIAEVGEAPEQPARGDAGLRLLDLLLMDAAALEHPILYAALRLGGIFEIGDEPLSDEPVMAPDISPTEAERVDLGRLDPLEGSSDYVRPIPHFAEPVRTTPVRARRTVRIDRLRTLLTSPIALFESVSGWGSTSFAAAALLGRLADLFRSLGLPASFLARADANGAGEEAVSALADVTLLNVPVYSALAEYGTVHVRVTLTALPATDVEGTDFGLALTPLAEGATELSFPISDECELGLTGDLDLSGDVRIVLRPPLKVTVERDPYGSGHGDTSGALSGMARFAPAEGITLLSQAGLLTLSATAVEMSAELLASEGGLIPRFGVTIIGGHLELGASEGDSFLREIVPNVSASFDFGLGWDESTGFVLNGSAGLEVAIPIGRQIGPVRVDVVTVSIETGEADALLLRATVVAAIQLGPIAGSVDGIGVELPVSIAESGGNLGKLHVNPPHFVPPTGLGLVIDAGVAVGGGYLYLDSEKGEYAGVAELAMLGVGVTAIGLLATKLPDGSEGWSMFLSLSITFTGLQLGFGFTLNGLGGLVGVNRGLDDEALADGVRTGALDGMLFPDNPVADAPRILADLDAVFPSVLGQFVFGPVVKIGWGTPTLVTLDLGIVIQLPEPLTVSLLGSLEALLPTADAAVIELRLDVAGTLNITEGTLKIDASLRDSRVLTLELTGDLAVRASFLDDPTFLVAFGGFHPDFTAPADFPELQLLAVAFDTGAALRIQLGGYFALTSNTLQFGAELSLWVKALGFTAEGGTTFDALVYFAPFGFAIDLRLWVSVRAGSFDLLGVELTGELTGPNPWYVAGSATFKLLGVKKSLDLEVTVGDRQADAPQEVVYVEELLIAELQLPDAWSALPPTGDGDAVVLVDGDSDARQVHPAGRIEVRQRIVPLDTRIDHYGNASLGGADSFELTAPRIGTQPVAASDREDVQDFFAAAQYFELAEDEKLSAPSFEQMNAGIRLGDDGIEAGRAAEMTFDHEVVYRDPNVRSADRETTGALFVATQTALSRAVSLGASLGARTAARLPRSTKSAGAFAVQAATFVALKTDTGVVASELTPAAGTSFFAARDSVMGAKNPNRAVVPAYVLELLR